MLAHLDPSASARVRPGDRQQPGRSAFGSRWRCHFASLGGLGTDRRQGAWGVEVLGLAPDFWQFPSAEERLRAGQLVGAQHTFQPQPEYQNARLTGACQPWGPRQEILSFSPFGSSGTTRSTLWRARLFRSPLREASRPTCSEVAEYLDPEGKHPPNGLHSPTRQPTRFEQRYPCAEHR